MNKEIIKQNHHHLRLEEKQSYFDDTNMQALHIFASRYMLTLAKNNYITNLWLCPLYISVHLVLPLTYNFNKKNC